ncbi:hypothetical protein [Desertibacillus haloalkaliphilus]|uniref:hypothetical protein n=1 Tax=Desertibacillus haloalkaliphilus TaxID=1328930 RepID=UPI001C2581D6|nr:hypothetical protein [Desertibacillus haloalkaliphilus]MBU8905370.1 hypothetical protein [Desertibacillus haloalkaliphilus]
MWKAIAIMAVAVVLASCQNVDEQQLFSDYREVLGTVDELFSNHARAGGVFYNQDYQTEDEVRALLEGKVTSDGIDEIISNLFREEEGRLVYNEPFQQYLQEANYDTVAPVDTGSYYRTVCETILNPGLQLMIVEQFEVEPNDEAILLIAEGGHVYFYDEADPLQLEQYQRYGYPPHDTITVALSFIRERDRYLLDNYRISAG